MRWQADALTRRRVLLVVFVSLLLLQQSALIWLYWGHGAKVLVGDEASYLAWARGLAGLAPLPPPTGWWPPLQAWLLAALLRLGGEAAAIPLLQLLQSICLIAAAALLRALWRDIDGRVRAANLAAALFLLNPSTMAYAHWLWPEPIHLLLLLAAVRWAQQAVPRYRAFAAGAAAGGALLAKSLLSAFWPLLLLLQWRWRERRWDWRAALLLLLGLGLVTAEPLRQGWQLSGKPMIADSSAFNLVGGLSDRWRSDYVDDSVATLAGEYFALPLPLAERNAQFLQRAHDMVAQRGLLATLGDQLQRQYFRLFNAKTLLLTQLPGPRCAGYLGSYPTPAASLVTGLSLGSTLLHALTLVGGIAGLVFWRRWRHPLIWWIVLFFGYQCGLYLLLHVKARFLLPMLPFFCGLAASAWVSAQQRPLQAAVVLHGRGRAVLAVLASALVLALAFLGPLLDHSCG